MPINRDFIGREYPAPDTYEVSRELIRRFADAIGDASPVYRDIEAAKAQGYPDVIAHGMLTMATAARLVTDWAGDPGAVVEYGVRFSSPVVVPDDDKGTILEVSGAVVEKLDGNRVAVDLDARVGDAKVLAKARAIVQLA